MRVLSTLLLAAATVPVALATVDSIFENYLRQSYSNDVITTNETPNARLIFPPSRGSSSLVQNIAPCQGYMRSKRAEYPVMGGKISWAAVFDLDHIQFRFSTLQDPKAQADFHEVLTNVTGGWEGQQCIDGPNFQTIGLRPGNNVTLQFYYRGGPKDPERFECADLTLVSVDDFRQGNWETGCVNYVETLKSFADNISNPHLASLRAAAQVSAAATSASAAATSLAPRGRQDNNLTIAQAGVIGAMVTLAVLGLVGFAAWLAGVVTISLRARATTAISRSFEQWEIKTLPSH